MILLKQVRGRQKLSLTSVIVVLVILALCPCADFDKVNQKKNEDLPEGVVKVQGKTPIVAAGSTNTHVKRKPSPLSQTGQVELTPATLNFREQAVGVPRTLEVLITNNNSKTIQITSVSGNSLSFHPAPPSTKVIKPGEKVSFDVVFLPRELGAVTGTLNIYTSLGTIYQEVLGSGTPNPYRLHPLTGSKIPVNGSYAPIITMYNPHPSPLQVTEMYSSGGGINLELVNGQLEGSQSLWVIRPFETKPIMRLSFVGHVASVHSGYVRIRTNSTDNIILILPVFVEVTKLQGVYIQRDHHIDFGIVKFGDAQKRMPLTLINTYKWDMEVTDLQTDPPDPVISFLSVASVLPAEGQRGTKVATIIFNADRLTYEGFHTGKVVVSTKDQDSVKKLKVVAYYRVIAMLGSLFSPHVTVAFRVEGGPPFKTLSQNITFNNHFKTPIVVYDVKLPMRKEVTDHFTVSIAQKPYVVPPDSGPHSVVTVRFTPSSADCLIASDVRVYSNSSSFAVPMYCYDGSVEYKVVSEDDLLDSVEFGVIAEKEVARRAFRVLNRNPITITINEIVFKNLEDVEFVLVGYRPISTCNSKLKVDHTGHSCNVTDYSDAKNSSTPQSKVTIEKDHEAVFEVVVSEPQHEGQFSGEITMTTSMAKELTVPVNLKVILGSLELQPDHMTFKSHVFKDTSYLITAVSHFNNPIRIINITTPTGDERFVYKHWTPNKFPILHPSSTTQLGVLTFNALANYRSFMHNYVGLHPNVVAPEEWLGLLSQIVDNYNVTMADTKSYKLNKERWKKVQDKEAARVEGEMVFYTNGSTVHRIPLEADYICPEVASQSQLEFQPTLITESSVERLTLHNPADVPVVVQVVPLNYYPSVVQLLPLLSDRLSSSVIKQLRQNTRLSVFTLPEAPAESETSEDPSLGSGITVSRIIQPNASISVAVKFSPTSPLPYLSLLLIRNNLTIIETVLLEGEGITPQLYVEGRESGATSPILFEYTEKMLSKCESPKNPSSQSVYLVQALSLNNSSPAVVVVRSVSIDGLSCVAYGYHIPHCQREITIQPNSSTKLEVKHTPDFTLSRIAAQLHVRISDTTVLTYPLLTTLPHHMLSACYTVMPRPLWERYVSQGLFVVMVMLLGLVVLLAMRNANLLLKRDLANNGQPLYQGAGLTTHPKRDVASIGPSTGGREQEAGPLPREPVLDLRTLHSADQYNRASVLEPEPGSSKISSLSIEVPSMVGKVASSAICRLSHGDHMTSAREDIAKLRRLPPESRPGQDSSLFASNSMLLSNTTTNSWEDGRNESVSSGDFKGTKDGGKSTDSGRQTLSPGNTPDKDKQQQLQTQTSKRSKQTSGRKQQQTKQLQSRTQVQQQTPVAKSPTALGKTDVSASRHTTDSTSSLESESGLNKKINTSLEKQKNDSTRDKIKDSWKETGVVAVEGRTIEASSAVSKKELLQLSKRDRKKKLKSIVPTSTSDPVAIESGTRGGGRRSQSPVSALLSGGEERGQGLAEVPSTARSSLESLTSLPSSTVEGGGREEGAETGAMEQKNSSPVTAVLPSGGERKGKKAHQLDEISPDSPVPARRTANSPPSASAKTSASHSSKIKPQDSQKVDSSKNESLPSSSSSSGPSSLYGSKKIDKAVTGGAKKASGKRQAINKSSSLDHSRSSPQPPEGGGVEREDNNMAVADSQSPDGPTKNVNLSGGSGGPSLLSPHHHANRDEGAGLGAEERRLTSPHELAAQLLRSKHDGNGVGSPAVATGGRKPSDRLESGVSPESGAWSQSDGKGKSSASQVADSHPSLGSGDSLQTEYQYQKIDFEESQQQKSSEEVWEKVQGDGSHKRSLVSSPTKGGASSRPSHPYSAHLTSKGGKPPLVAGKSSEYTGGRPEVSGPDGSSVTTSVFFQGSGNEDQSGGSVSAAAVYAALSSSSSTAHQSRFVSSKPNKSLGDFLPPHVISSSRDQGCDSGGVKYPPGTSGSASASSSSGNGGVVVYGGGGGAGGKQPPPASSRKTTHVQPTPPSSSVAIAAPLQDCTTAAVFSNFSPEFTKYGGAVTSGMGPASSDHGMGGSGETLGNPSQTAVAGLSHGLSSSGEQYLMRSHPGTVPPPPPHHPGYGQSAVRKRPGHLDITQHMNPAAGGVVSWHHPAQPNPGAPPAPNQGYVDQMRYYQHQPPHPSPAQHSSYSLYGQTPPQPSQQQQQQQQQQQHIAVRFTGQPELGPAQTSTTVSSLELLNQLTRQPIHSKKVPPQHPVPTPCDELGGEYLPLSSRLATPTTTAAVTLNLAPGATSVLGDHGNHPASISPPPGNTGSSYPPMWNSGASPQQDSSKPYGLFGSSSIWGPVTTSGSGSAPWMNALTTPTPTPTPTSVEGSNPTGLLFEKSPF